MVSYTDKKVDIKFMNYNTDLRVESVVTSTYGTVTLDIPYDAFPLDKLSTSECHGRTYVTVRHDYEKHNLAAFKRDGNKCRPEFITGFKFIESQIDVDEYIEHNKNLLLYIGYTHHKSIQGDNICLQIDVNSNACDAAEKQYMIRNVKSVCGRAGDLVKGFYNIIKEFAKEHEHNRNKTSDGDDQ